MEVIIYCCALILVTSMTTSVSHENSISVAVKIPGKDGLLIAKRLARKYQFQKVSKIGNLDEYYAFENRASHIRVRRGIEELYTEKEIQWIEQQIPKRRYKRNVQLRPIGTAIPTFNDPLYPDQWYLNGHLSGSKPDINVIPAWAKGYSGTGIVITILDDGIEHNHTDLSKNYDPNASWDINDDDPDPFPRYDPHDENKHGTRCAGEVAAIANNNYCGVGVAFNSRIGGVRMLDGHVTDKVEAASLSLNPQYVDIYSSSWGPNDDGKTVEGPGTLAHVAILNGINKGRKGLGSLYVWASGNGGHHDDDCNCDGYANSIYTLSINSATDQGDVPWYSETCASSLASTLSSGAYKQKRIITTDLHNTCTNNHTGTSASAPIAAGIYALLLESNSNLTWRDVQHLTIFTADCHALMKGGNWTRNSIGLYFHQNFGFGLIDAAKLIEWATDSNWETCPEKHVCLAVDTKNEPRPFNAGQELYYHFYIDSCINTSNEVNYVEHVQIVIDLDHTRRGDMSVDVYSPSGTRSPILDNRREDDSSIGFTSWTMMTVHFWGEDPRGVWTVKFKDSGSLMSTNIGVVKSCALIIHGTKTITYYQQKFTKQYKLKRSRDADNSFQTFNSFRNFENKQQVKSNQDKNIYEKYLNYMAYIQYQDYIDSYKNRINILEPSYRGYQ